MLISALGCVHLWAETGLQMRRLPPAHTQGARVEAGVTELSKAALACPCEWTSMRNHGILSCSVSNRRLCGRVAEGLLLTEQGGTPEPKTTCSWDKCTAFFLLEDGIFSLIFSVWSHPSPTVWALHEALTID